MARIVQVARYTADGSQAKGELRAIGEAGQKMSRDIRDGALSVPPALRALDVAGAEVRQNFEGIAARGGATGRVLQQLGPAGAAAAVGLGAVLLTTNALIPAIDKALINTTELYAAARRINASAEFIQEWRFAATQAGYDTGILTQALTDLNVRLGEMRTGLGTQAINALTALGFSRDEIDQLQTAEDALPRIADGLRNLSRESERADIADKLGLKDILPLLRQGSEEIDRVAARARELGVVIDDDVVRRGYELRSAWSAASAALDAQFTVALIDFLPVASSALDVITKMASAAADLSSAFLTLDQQSNRHLARRLGDLQEERTRLRQRFPVSQGVDPLANGNADRGARMREAFNAQGAVEFFGGTARQNAADRLAAVDAEEAQVIASLRRRAAAGFPTVPGGANSSTNITAVAEDPEIARLRGVVEAQRMLSTEREALARIEREHVGITREEAEARRELERTMADLQAARERGVLGSDAELQAARDVAQANFDAAHAERQRAAALNERNAIEQRARMLMDQVENPSERMQRQEREARQLFLDSQGTDAAVSEDQLSRRLEQIRDEYRAIADAQYEASLAGQVLQGVIDGQIRSFDDLQRTVSAILMDSVVRELLSGGVRNGGWGGFASRVSDRIGDSIGVDFRDVFGGRRDDGVSDLNAAAKEAGGALSRALTPSVGEAAAKLGVSVVATNSESVARQRGVFSLGVMTKAADAAAKALSKVAAESGGADFVSMSLSALSSGPGRAGGGDLWRGYRHAGAERGPEIAVFGGWGQVLPNNTFEDLRAVAAQARRAPAASPSPTRIAIIVRNESGVEVEASARETVNADGTAEIELHLRRAVSGQIVRGDHDNALRGRYGLPPQRTRRG